MNNYLKKTLQSSAFLSLIIASSTPALATELYEALAQSYQNNPSLAAERARLRAADEAIPQALSGWLPNVSASWQRAKEDRDVDGVDSERIADTKSISITQPVFRGGASLAQYKQAKYSIESARHTLKQAEQNILLGAATAYMDIVQAQEVHELNINNVSVLKKQLNATKERFRLGEVTRTDVAQAEASLAEAQAQEISAKGDLDSVLATYERAVGIPPENISMPEEPTAIEGSLEKFINTALDKNPQVKIAENDKLAAEKGVTIQRASIFPQVDLLANRQYLEGSFQFQANDIENTAISFQVTVPLYQSGAEYSRIREAKDNVRQLEDTYQEQRNRVREETIRAFQAYQVAKASIVSNKASIAAFESALEGTQQEAKVGSRTTLDVLDAEQDLFTAKVNLVLSQRNAIVNYFSLMSQLGKLNVEELQLNVTAYDPYKHYNSTKIKFIGF